MRLYLITFILISTGLFAQNKIGTGAADKLYETYCMSCHGPDLKGGQGNSLLDASTWKRIGPKLTFLEYVREGDIESGMPPFKDGLSDPQIRSLEIYIDEMRQKSEVRAVEEKSGLYSAGGYEYRLETVAEDLKIPWSIAFLPDGSVLVAERPGTLRKWKGGKIGEAIKRTPKVFAKGQGGLLEVAAHPQYSKNGWIYLGFSASDASTSESKSGMTKIVRGRIQAGEWRDEEVIFEVPPKYHRTSGNHFGTRIVFKDGYLFFGIGDRGAQDQAQDLSLPNGKIHRIHDDGAIPNDNPFINKDDAYPSIWTYGNRNPQGLDAHPLTGEIWESEHGPRGGDEINLIRGGLNYGWPVITYGMNYNGKPITEKTSAPGMEQPAHYWTPSIAVCGIDFYEGDAFPNWKNNLLAGGLASQELQRLVIEGDQVVENEIILKNEGRVRDVATGPDGLIYVVLNGPDRIARLVPAK